MTRSSTSALLLPLAVSGLLVACGPTQTGIDNREAAVGRLNAANAQLGYDQAYQAFEVGQFDRALREIDKAIEVVPDAAEFHVLRGRIQMEENAQLEDAMRCFEQAIELDEENAEAHYFAGIVHQRWSEDREAFEKYEKAFEVDSANVQYLLAAAESLVAMGDYQGARTLVKEKLARFEHNAALRHLLGQIALLEGHPAQAAEHYREARLLRPDDMQLLEELARAQFSAEQYGPCMESVTELKRRGEKRDDLKHLEARCLVMLNRAVEARNLYRKLTRSRPNDPVLWVELGTIAWELDDFPQVAKAGDRVVALDPARFEGYLLQGIYKRSEGDLATAIRKFREAADHSSDAALPHLVLGLTLEEAGDREQARQAYAAAVRIEPNHATARALLLESERMTSVIEPGGPGRP